MSNLPINITPDMLYGSKVLPTGLGLKIPKEFQGPTQTPKAGLGAKIGGYLQAAGTAVDLIQGAFNNAKIDNSRQNAEISRFNADTNYNNLNDIANAMGKVPTLGMVSAKDLHAYGGNLYGLGGNQLLGGLGAGMKGASAGLAVGGPWGAAIGGVLGIGSSIIGSLAGNHKAEREAERQNAIRKDYNDFAYDNLLNNGIAVETANNNMVGLNYHSLGGELAIGGASYPLGLMPINAGGTHEQNPYNGVQVGVDPNGTPNLVEEGETIYNDYVFSNRLDVPKSILKKYKLGGKMTFADASKKLAKPYDERPNDPISQRTLDAILGDLSGAQEEVRMKQAMSKGITGINPNMMQQAYGYGGNLFAGPIITTNTNTVPDIYPTTVETTTSSGQNPLIIYNGNAPTFKGTTYAPDSLFTKYRNMYSNYWGLDEFKEVQEEYLHQIYEGNKNRKNFKSKYKSFDDFVKNVTKSDFEKYTSDGIRNGEDYAPADGYWHKLKGTKAEEFFNRIYGNKENPAQTPIQETKEEKKEEVKAQRKLGDRKYYTTYDKHGTPTNTLIKNYDEWSKDHPNAQYINTKHVAEGDTDYTDMYYEDKKPNDQKALPTWMRYVAPKIQLAAAAQGLLTPAGYSNADAMIEASKNAGNYMEVFPHYIGNRMRYTPVDENRTANAIMANARATDRNILNTSGMNRGQAIAGLLANGYNTNLGLGNAYAQDEQANWGRYGQVSEFNRGTDQFNAQADMITQQANQNALAQARSAQLQGTLQGYGLREKIAQDRINGIMANLSGFAQSLGDIGYDNLNHNMANSTWGRIGGWSSDNKGVSTYDRNSKRGNGKANG